MKKILLLSGLMSISGLAVAADNGQAYIDNKTDQTLYAQFLFRDDPSGCRSSHGRALIEVKPHSQLGNDYKGNGKDDDDHKDNLLGKCHFTINAYDENKQLIATEYGVWGVNDYDYSIISHDTPPRTCASGYECSTNVTSGTNHLHLIIKGGFENLVKPLVNPPELPEGMYRTGALDMGNIRYSIFAASIGYYTAPERTNLANIMRGIRGTYKTNETKPRIVKTPLLQYETVCSKNSEVSVFIDKQYNPILSCGPANNGIPRMEINNYSPPVASLISHSIDKWYDTCFIQSVTIKNGAVSDLYAQCLNTTGLFQNTVVSTEKCGMQIKNDNGQLVCNKSKAVTPSLMNTAIKNPAIQQTGLLPW